VSAGAGEALPQRTLLFFLDLVSLRVACYAGLNGDDGIIKGSLWVLVEKEI
jgi:hypothetical protein